MYIQIYLYKISYLAPQIVKNKNYISKIIFTQPLFLNNKKSLNRFITNNW